MKTLIVDGNNALMRAIYATQHSGMSHHGINTGPLNTFIGTIAHLVRTECPKYMAVAWDSGGPNHRHAISSDYKGNRVKGPIAELKETAFPQAKEFLRAAGIDQAEIPGFEADDIIASWWFQIKPPSVPPRPPAVDTIVIASSDKDFLQLTGENPEGIPTVLLRFSSSEVKTDRWDAVRLLDEHGIEPHQWPLVTALTGDISDNVVGIPGIGPKRALAMLKRYDWNLGEAVLAEKADYVEQVHTNLQLVNLRNPRIITGAPPAALDLPIPSAASAGRFTTFLGRYGLQETLRRFDQGRLWREKKTPGRPLTFRP